MRSTILIVGVSVLIFTILITVVIVLSLNCLEKQQGYRNSNSQYALSVPSRSAQLVLEHKVESIKSINTINKTVLLTRSYQILFNRRSKLKKKISFSQIWVVTKAIRNLEGLDAGFITIRRNVSLNSAIVGTFPVGSILIGRRIRIISHENLNVLITRLEIVFPMSGWVTVFVSGSTSSLHAVDVSFHALFTTSNISYRNNINFKNNNINPTKPVDFCAEGNRNGSSSRFLLDVDLLGGDLPENGQASADSPVTCCRLCESDPICKAWTWTLEIGAESDGQCWMKGGSYQIVREGNNKDPNKPSNMKRMCVSGVISQQMRFQQLQQQQQQGKSQVRAMMGHIGDGVGVKRQIRTTKLAVPLGSIFIQAFCCNNSRQQDTFKPSQSTMSIFRSDKIKPSTSNIDVLNMFDFRDEAVVHVKDRRSVIQAAPTILNIQRTSNEWTQQWPIGNGRFGALVGGSISNERIPISIAGFVVKGILPSEQEAVGDRENGKVFKEARELFKKGLIKLASSKLNELVKPGLGMFQYIFDLQISYKVAGQSGFGPLLLSDGILDIRNGIAYSTFLEQCEPTIRNVAASSHGRRKSKKTKQKSRKSRRKFSSALRFHHREWFASEVDQVMVGYLTCRKIRTTSVEEMMVSGSGTGKVSTWNGTTKSKDNFGFRDFDREQRSSFQSDEYDDGNCLHLSLQLGREAGDPAPTFSVSDMKQVHLSQDIEKLWSDHSKDKFKDLNIAAYSFETALESNDAVRVPLTVTSGVFICIWNTAKKYSGVGGGNAKGIFIEVEKKDTIGCTNAEKVYVVISAESENKIGYRNITQPKMKLIDMRRRNKDRIENALNLGFTSLKLRHSQHFAERMDRVDFHLDSTNETQTCAASLEAGRLNSFYSGCVVDMKAKVEAENIFEPPRYDAPIDVPPPQQIMENVDVRLLSSAFQFGRYLLFSAATSSVSNLQGLWADGPTSAWNGDYHLNINVQMAYWPANTVAMPEVIAPLLMFLKDLSNSGRTAAREMYGCKNALGWVAHGFTDSDLDGGIWGDTQWSLCVTCGAWLAVQAWDSLLYHRLDQSSVRSTLVQEFIPIFRGIASFFLDYMVVLPSLDNRTFAHTGPTTSPENSYEIKFTDSGKHPNLPQSIIFTLALSPAIDSSILRQVSSYFTISLDWASDTPVNGDPILEEYLSSQLVNDRILAEAFTQLIAQMPNRAMPTVDKRSGAIAEYPIPITGKFPNVGVPPPHIAQPNHLIPNLRNIQNNVLQQQQQKQQQNQQKRQLQQQQLPPEQQPVLSAEQLQLQLQQQQQFQFQNLQLQPPLPPPPPPPLQVDQWEGVSMNSIQIIDRPHFIDDGFDSGHRHFSSMHWLFPNALPLATMGTSTYPEKQASDNKQILDAARRTMQRKMDNKGGHTSWSASWEACLWARLGEGDNAMQAIARIINRFMTPTLLSLHPALQKSGVEECHTCFSEGFQSLNKLHQPVLMKPQRTRSTPHDGQLSQVAKLKFGQVLVQVQEEFTYEDWVEELNAEVEENIPAVRGMVTREDAKVDGNMGLVAAMCEILLQDNIPGFISLLPALPKAMQEQGFVRRLKVKGDGEVSISWKHGAIDAALLSFHSPHAWLMGLREQTRESNQLPGFYRAASKQEDGSAYITVLSPNQLRAYVATSSSSSSSSSPQSTERNRMTLLRAEKANAIKNDTLASLCATLQDENARRQQRYPTDLHTTTTNTGKKLWTLKLIIRRFPCEIKLCKASTNTNNNCGQHHVFSTSKASVYE